MNRDTRKTTSFGEGNLPETFEIECQVITDLIAEPSLTIEVQKIVKGDMFTIPETQSLWAAIVNNYTAGTPVDLITMQGIADRDFAMKYILPKLGGVSAMAVLGHAATLRSTYLRRQAWIGASELMKIAGNPTANEADIMSVPQRIGRIITESYTSKSTQSIVEAVNMLAEQIQTGNTGRVRSGYPRLDKAINTGFGAGNLVILAARPSVGKTSVGLSMARAAAQAGTPTAFFSLEMTNAEIVQKLMLGTGIVTPDMFAGNMDWSAFEMASAQVDNLPLFLEDSVRLLDDIIAKITLLHQQGKCDIAYIDYLGLISYGHVRDKTITQLIGEATGRLKQLAKTLRIPIVLLCQLNRASAAEKREPQLYDLRDSGNIEQDADIVIMLSRNTDGMSGVNDLESRVVNLWLRKNRGGVAGDVRLKIEADNTFNRFYEIM